MDFKNYLAQQFKGYHNIAGGIITPQMFGAKADGVTDDTMAIKKAISAIQNTKQVIFFPSGIYLVSSTINLNSNTTIIGIKGRSILQVDNTTTNYWSLLSAQNNKTNIHIKGMTFKGHETLKTVTLAFISTCTDVSFDNCLFQNNVAEAIKLANGTSNVKVFNCRFEATDCGVISQGTACSDVTIRDCHFTGLSSYDNYTNYGSEPISIYENGGGVSRRWVIENCIFEHKHTVAVLFQTSSHAPSKEDKILVESCAIKNIIVRDCTSAVSMACSKDILVDGIYFDTTQHIFTDGNLIGCIGILDYCEDVHVQNIVDTNREQVMMKLSTAQTTKNCIIENAQFYATALKEGATRPDPAIQLMGENIVVKNVKILQNETQFTGINVQLLNLTNSYVDIEGDELTKFKVTYYIPDLSTTTNNTLVVHTETNGKNVPHNFNTVDTNIWKILGKGKTTTGSLQYIFNNTIPYAFQVLFSAKNAYDASLAVTDFKLLNEGAELIIEFVNTTFTTDKTFTFATGGNIVAIPRPFTFSPDYIVVCKFVQKNAKWVEVERVLEYYEGANVRIGSGNVSEEQIAQSVAQYIENNPIEGGKKYTFKPAYDANKKYYYYDNYIEPTLKDTFYIVEIETKNIAFNNGETSFALQWQKANGDRQDIYRIKYADANASGTHVNVPNVNEKVVTQNLDFRYEKIRVVIQSHNADAEVTVKLYEYTAKEQRFLKDVNSVKNLHLYAHRGYTPEAPENSIPSFELAGKYGFWGCETDVFKTKDNVLVCMHDETIDRMTNGTGTIANMTYAQLQSYTIDTGNNISAYTSEELRIPTFEDYLKICKKFNLVPFIEIKDDIVDYVMPIIIEYGLEDVAILSSSNFALLYKSRKYAPIFIHFIRYDSNDVYIDYISKLGNGGINFDTSNGYIVTSDKVKELNNKKVAFCERAGDTVESIISMIERGCTYIPTNSVKPNDVYAYLEVPAKDKVEQLSKKDTIAAIQKYGKRQFEKSMGTVIYDFDINNIVGSTSFEYEYDFSKVKRSVRALKLSTDDTLRYASVILKLNTEITKAETTDYGMWFYVPPITYEHLSYIQLKGGIYTSNAFSNGEVICQIPKTSLGQGWNFWKFNEPTSNTSFNAISIMIVDESATSDTTHFVKEVYFDSIIKGYELNPTILLTFDNSTDENLYDYCFKQAKAKGVVGTFAYQNGSSPDGAVLGSAYSNGVTREHLKEMILSGWDCTQYDGYPLDSGINAIKAYNKALKDENLDMYCYFARFNRMTADIFNSLDSMDFKMARTSNSEKYNSALGQSAYTSVGLTFSNGFSSIKSNVDYAIAHGKILCIVIHKVLDTQDSTENNCLKSDYENLINYLAEKQSNNELKIATFKELYYSDLRTEIINVIS